MRIDRCSAERRVDDPLAVLLENPWVVPVQSLLSQIL